MDNGWVLSLIQPVLMEFNKSIVDSPRIKRFPNLQIRRTRCPF